jgi:sodium/hydrogen antiporter
MLDVAFAVVGAVAVGLGLASRPLRNVPLSEPLVALALGVVLSPALLGALELPPGMEHDILKVAAEVVLAMSLMAVALRFPPSDVRKELGALAVLLTVVLVGMAVVSTGLALLVGVPVAGALLLGTIVAPTDPVLASSIVAGEPAVRTLPQRLRLLLSVESGANDGLAFALVALGVAVSLGQSVGLAAGVALFMFTVSVVVGGGLGWAVGRLLNISERHHDMEHSAFIALTLFLALFLLGTVNLAGGEGVLGVFVGGLAYGHELTRSERREEWEVQEAINRFLVLPVFTLLGVSLPWQAWVELGWRGPALVAAVLLLRRPLLVLVLRRPLRLPPDEAAFAGWYGPIGVAALYYLADGRGLGAVDELLWALGTMVIFASTVLHGVTATPGRKLFARRRG